MHIAFVASECVPFAKTGGLSLTLLAPCPRPSPTLDTRSVSTFRVIANARRMRRPSFVVSPFRSTTSTASVRL